MTRRLLRFVPACAIVATASILGAPRDADADIYQYIDADGTLHFTNTPSPKQPWKLYEKSKDGGANKKIVPTHPLDPDRYTRFDEVIHEAAGYYQLPEAFVRAIVKVESDYDPAALSIAGAQGLMQLMPDTAANMMVTDAWDPRENVFGGCRYLRVLANTFNGDLDLTIAAYNAGEGAVIRAGGIPDIAETQDYVVKVKAWYRRYRAMDPVEASVGGSEEP